MIEVDVHNTPVYPDGCYLWQQSNYDLAEGWLPWRPHFGFSIIDGNPTAWDFDFFEDPLDLEALIGMNLASINHKEKLYARKVRLMLAETDQECESFKQAVIEMRAEHEIRPGDPIAIVSRDGENYDLVAWGEAIHSVESEDPEEKDFPAYVVIRIFAKKRANETIVLEDIIHPVVEHMEIDFSTVLGSLQELSLGKIYAAKFLFDTMAMLDREGAEREVAGELRKKVWESIPRIYKK